MCIDIISVQANLDMAVSVNEDVTGLQGERQGMRAAVRIVRDDQTFRSLWIQWPE